MKNSHIFYTIIISALMLFLFNYQVYGDSLELIDKSIIVGKIIEEQDTSYLIANSRGTYKVNKKYIKEIHETSSFEEDIEIQKKLGKKFDSNLIRKNYLAGVRTKMLSGGKRKDNDEKEGASATNTFNKKGKKKYSTDWDFGRIHISGTYFFTLAIQEGKIHRVTERLPAGFSVQLAYEQGLDMLVKKKIKRAKTWDQNNTKKNYDDMKKDREAKMKRMRTRPWYVPGIRVELSYLYFTREIFVDKSREVSGFTLTAGPMWAFPSPLNYWGCIVLAGQPGYTFLDVFNRETEEEGKSYTFTFTGILGYEYAIKEKVSLALHCRYTYISDPKVSFHSIGVSFGLSIRLW